jgi:hypothetical protein
MKNFLACFRENDHFHAQNWVYKFGHLPDCSAKTSRLKKLRLWITCSLEWGMYILEVAIKKEHAFFLVNIHAYIII